MTVVVFKNGVEVARKSFNGTNTIVAMHDWLRWSNYNTTKYDVRAI